MSPGGSLVLDLARTGTLRDMNKRVAIPIVTAIALIVLVGFFQARADDATDPVSPPEPEAVLDTVAYDRKLLQLANRSEEKGTTSDKVYSWPASAVYPNVGAILPFKRIVAYYGNFSSISMGVLGAYPLETMLEKLRAEVKKWEEADAETPVMPAIDYIAVVAQAGAGKDGLYRLRMSDTEIQKALTTAERVGGIVILEVQPGLANLMTEIRALEPYLSLPQVHLAIDPEFVMQKYRQRPGTAVGTVDAKDINAAAEYLATLVRDHALPPKILVVHRYTNPMVTNADKIKPLPEVQVVVDMDGWGPPSQKFASYESYVASQPVQFTGFKLFYRNDVRRGGSRLLTPKEVLKLVPRPSFIQYQ